MLSSVEGRVLGCLLEKQRTVPDQYPLSLHALQTACTQSTARDPVMRVDERDVEVAVLALKGHGLARVVHPTSARGVTKYRQVIDEKLELDPAEAAIVALLLLRGPQTAGELRTRAERLHAFGGVNDVEDTLQRLHERSEPLARSLERQPGQKEIRWQQLLAEESAIIAGAGGVVDTPSGSVADRLTQLEARVARLEQLLADLGEPAPT